MKTLKGLFRIESAAKPLACAAALALAASVPAADLGTLEVGSKRLDVVRADDGMSLLAWSDSQTGARASVDLPVAIERVNSLSASGDRVAIVAQATPDAEAVFAYRAGSDELADSFLGSQVSVSPNGRYAAFKRFKPRFDHSPEMSGDVYVVYDFQAPAADMRRAPEAAGESMLAGRPVYPMDNFATGSHLAIGGRENASNLRSRFHWTSDTEFAFVDSREGIVSLVTVDVANGLDNAVQRERVLPVEDWVKPGATADETARALRSFAVVGMEVQGEGLKMDFAETGLMGSKTAWIDLSN